MAHMDKTIHFFFFFFCWDGLTLSPHVLIQNFQLNLSQKVFYISSLATGELRHISMQT